MSGVVKDTADYIVKEVKEHLTEVENLKDTVVNVGGKVVTVKHKVLPTKHDGKNRRDLICDILKGKHTYL